MKKKVLAMMLTLTLVMAACGTSASNDVAEDTETVVTTEAEVNTEVVAGGAPVIVEPTEIPAEPETEAVETTEIAEETIETEGEFAIVAMSVTKYAKSSVNVRKGPSSEYEKIGSLSTNQEVKVIGQADTGWYQIELDGEIAYVSDNYLVDEKVAVAEKPSESAGEVADNGSALGNVGESNSTSTPDAGCGDVASEPETEDIWGDDWDDAPTTGGIGTGTPTTDGEGPGVEIEITPLP